MAIAHVCNECGLDLARTRPVREPHYGLLLVTCPRCSRHCVRRRHPFVVWWRTLLRVDASITALGLQIVAAGGFAALTFVSIATLAAVFADMLTDGTSRAALFVLILCIVGLPIATGVWLGAAFTHLRWWQAWLGWAGFLYGLAVVIAGIASAVFMATAGLAPNGGWVAGTTIGGVTILTLAPVLVVMLIVTLCGMPLGRPLAKLNGFARRVRWRMRRKRRRLECAK